MNTMNLEIICLECQTEILDDNFFKGKLHQEIGILKAGFLQKFKNLIRSQYGK